MFAGATEHARVHLIDDRECPGVRETAAEPVERLLKHAVIERVDGDEQVRPAGAETRLPA